MDLDFAQRFKESLTDMEQYGNEYSEAKAQSWYQQEMKGHLLAKLMKQYVDMPVSRAEIEAKASDDYQAYLNETKKAIDVEGKLKSKYEKAKARFEGYRSLCSLEKKIIQNIGT